MDERTPGEPGFLPGTVWTRADAVRVGDRVFVRHDDGDLWALVIAIEHVGDPGKVRLKLMLELNGVPVGVCAHTPATSANYMRLLPR